MRNILLEKSYTKCGGETILKFFCKKSKISNSLNQNSIRFPNFNSKSAAIIFKSKTSVQYASA